LRECEDYWKDHVRWKEMEIDELLNRKENRRKEIDELLNRKEFKEALKRNSRKP